MFVSLEKWTLRINVYYNVLSKSEFPTLYKNFVQVPFTKINEPGILVYKCKRIPSRVNKNDFEMPKYNQQNTKLNRFQVS